MAPRFTDDYCCCRMFLIYQGVYLIAFHCLLQGAYGISLVVTSYYQPQQNVPNYLMIASNLCLIPTGIFLFWANIYESWKASKIVCIIVIFSTVFNLISACWYFAAYADFSANSALDKVLFWEDSKNWITAEDFPFTTWHIFAFVLIIINLLWFYYAYIMLKLADFLKRTKK